ncbi:hypothetical protein JMUB6875_19960 [Nocardia sp. JMUB6875]
MSVSHSVFHVAQHDPLAAPLLAELAIEYSSRYGRTPGEVHADLIGYSASHFAPPDGDLLVVVEDGEPVAGGAFQRFDSEIGYTALPRNIVKEVGHVHPFGKLVTEAVPA